MFKKEKSYIQSYKWVGIMLIAMGLMFFMPVLILLSVNNPNSIHAVVNGVRVTTQSGLRELKLIFSLVFGGTCLILVIVGSAIILRNRSKIKKLQRLVEEGKHIEAEYVSTERRNIRINGRYVCYIVCKYTDEYTGKTYVFESPSLRRDPFSFLINNKVHVYYNRDNMKDYYVDVDQSVGLGDRLIEL